MEVSEQGTGEWLWLGVPLVHCGSVELQATVGNPAVVTEVLGLVEHVLSVHGELDEVTAVEGLSDTSFLDALLEHDGLILVETVLVVAGAGLVLHHVVERFHDGHGVIIEREVIRHLVTRGEASEVLHTDALHVVRVLLPIGVLVGEKDGNSHFRVVVDFETVEKRVKIHWARLF